MKDTTTLWTAVLVGLLCSVPYSFNRMFSSAEQLIWVQVGSYRFFWRKFWWNLVKKWKWENLFVGEKKIWMKNNFEWKKFWMNTCKSEKGHHNTVNCSSYGFIVLCTIWFQQNVFISRATDLGASWLFLFFGENFWWNTRKLNFLLVLAEPVSRAAYPESPCRGGRGGCHCHCRLH